MNRHIRLTLPYSGPHLLPAVLTVLHVYASAFSVVEHAVKDGPSELRLVVEFEPRDWLVRGSEQWVWFTAEIAALSDGEWDYQMFHPAV